MKMMLGFPHLRERIRHLTHDAWNSIVTTTDHLGLRLSISAAAEVASRILPRRTSTTARTSGRDTRWLTLENSGVCPE